MSRKSRKKAFYVDEMGMPIDILDPEATVTMKPRCPVKVGDRFYRKNDGTEMGTCLRDYLKVLEIMPREEDNVIRARYENRAVGPFERYFSDAIFKSDDWEIVRN